MMDDIVKLAYHWAHTDTADYCPESFHSLLHNSLTPQLPMTMVQHSTPVTTSTVNYSPQSMDDDDCYLFWEQSPGGDSSSPGGSIRQQHSPGGLLALSQIKLEGDDDCQIVESEGHGHSSGKSSSSGSLPSHSSPVAASAVQRQEQEQTQTADYLRQKKKGGGLAGKSIEEELCLICGDRASGYHYNALSCEGCKGFFRRSITRGATYSCKYGGNCEMDMWMRRRCQSCRLRRCREVGMKEECLLSDDQCKARDVRRKARQRMQKTQVGADHQADLEQHSPDSNTSAEVVKKVEPELLQEDTLGSPLDNVTAEHKELIESVVYFQDKYELPTEEDLSKVSNIQVSDSGRPKDMSTAVYQMVAEMTILTTQLVVEFAKHLPGFSGVGRDDQIVLLKGSASEIMVLRTARRYDMQSQAIILGNGMPMTKSAMKLAGLEEYVENLFVFCHKMAVLAVDNAEYALITGMCLLTERPGLTDPYHIERLHDVYLHALIDYNRHRREHGSHFLAKLIMKFTDLRTVSQIHADSLYNLKLERGSLPPLLSEYFDVDNG